MKKLLLFIFLFFISSQAQAYTFIEKKVNGTLMRVVEYDVWEANYKLKVAVTQTWVELPVDTLLREKNMITGVNGVFFCPSDYSFCVDRPGTTNNERYVNGEKFAVQVETWERAVFAVDKDQNPFIFQSGRINYDDESNIEYGFSNRPLLLHSGSNMLERYYEVGLIDNKMSVKGTRNFVCSTQDKKKIYFWLVYGVTIDELVMTLYDFWCYDALNLDAGLSTALIYNNRHIVGPQRPVIDVMGIERTDIDTKILYERGQKAADIIINHTLKRTKNSSKQKEILQKYTKILDEARISIYNKNSSDVLVENLVWEIDNVWYQINLKSKSTLTRVLIINEINNILKSYIKKNYE